MQWQPGRGEGNWRLSLVKRPESTDEPTAAVQIFQADIDLARHASTIDWIGSDETYVSWVNAHLEEIAEEIRTRQEQERPDLMVRARVTPPVTTIRDFIPHIVILIALAAFAYMFAVVHIKI